ncbi:TPA: hypothetical protein RCG93_003596 [Enterobacter roggenkampii]|nr:hypothetical protein [Enterobacter cloacae]HDT2127197.1 hypothetical protein [Enterobacter roggenkampii]
MKWLILISLLLSTLSHAELEYLGNCTNMSAQECVNAINEQQKRPATHFDNYLGRSVSSAELNAKKSGYQWDGVKWVLPGSRRNAVAFQAGSDGKIDKIIEWEGNKINMIQ